MALLCSPADEEGSDNLMKVTLNLVPQAICNESFADGNNGQLSSGIVDEWQICAGEFGKDTCQVITSDVYIIKSFKKIKVFFFLI